MKKILYVLFMALLTFAGCKKEKELVFDARPEERMGEALATVNNSLSSAANGWIATLPTQAGGGYSFYMSFDAANETVKMYGDLTDESATKIGTSTYRMRANMGAELIFDTYNYISLLEDPNPSSFGGATGSGFKSDVEFIFDHFTTDSLIFRGKKYKQTLTMIKATAAQKNAYESEGLKAAMDKLKSFFINTANPYIEVVSGNATLKVGITINASNNLSTGKRLDFTGVLADGQTVSSSGQKYAFTLDGVSILNSGLIWQGVTFVSFKWKDPTTLAVYDSTGKEYIIKTSATPLVPLFQLWGSKYTGMLSEYKTIYPGTSTTGTTILNYFHNGLISSITGGYNFNYGRINYVWNLVNKRLTLNGFSSQNGGTSGWTTSIVYSYNVDANGVYKFTTYAAASGGYVANPLSQLNAFMLANSITFDYYVNGSTVYAKMTSVEDPSIVMTFVLQ
ncbi:DUF4302 domain-containing protein [Pedobacter chinensis]|uniref:DUF4302 domain-containing protein n=1 Tax=Pedobacter chinensis TaxID=2282421 RepID=A0A369PUM9_9SPHI|nr:DUF4302 domain-containing protein [Pedobacter chinensis]RDC54955.1 DUF4302 domain-containing protein [Pedobacter chinensis]